MTIVVVASAFLAQSLLALGPVSCGQQLRPCCGGPNQVLVVVVTDLKCRMTATRISSAPPGGAYESFALIAAADLEPGRLAEEYLRGVRKVATLSAAEWGNEPTVSR